MPIVFKLSIECDNDAFDDRNAEVARILLGLAARVRHGDLDLLSRGTTTQWRSLIDFNGNTVGYATYELVK